MSGIVSILKYFNFKILLILSHFLLGWSAGIISIIFVPGLQKIIFEKAAPWAPIITEELLNKFICFLKDKYSGLYNIREKKDKAQPTRVKTGGRTFKNPKNKTEKKVWQLIKSSIPNNLKFGDAQVSEKHVNFFINNNNATYKDMRKLIDFVKKKVKEKTGIEIDLEIVIVEWKRKFF